MSCLRSLPDCPAAREGSEARKAVEANFSAERHRQLLVLLLAHSSSGTFATSHYGRRGRVSMFGTTFASPRCAPAVVKEDRAEIPCAACAHSRRWACVCTLSGGDAKSAASHRHAGSPACEVRASSKAYARNARSPLFAASCVAPFIGAVYCCNEDSDSV